MSIDNFNENEDISAKKYSNSRSDKFTHSSVLRIITIIYCVIVKLTERHTLDMTFDIMCIIQNMNCSKSDYILYYIYIYETTG